MYSEIREINRKSQNNLTESSLNITQATNMMQNRKKNTLRNDLPNYDLKAYLEARRFITELVQFNIHDLIDQINTSDPQTERKQLS